MRTRSPRFAGAAAVDRARFQEIVTGALGGEETIEVVVDPLQHKPTARLRDARAGTVLASVRRRDGRWVGVREGSPLSGGYIPNLPASLPARRASAGG